MQWDLIAIYLLIVVAATKLTALEVEDYSIKS